jgi:hypothetical protein
LNITLKKKEKWKLFAREAGEKDKLCIIQEKGKGVHRSTGTTRTGPVHTCVGKSY